MEAIQWQTVVQGVLSSSPVAAALGFACFKLWGKLEAKEAVIAEKDKVIAQLSEARVQDLKAIARQND